MSLYFGLGFEVLGGIERESSPLGLGSHECLGFFLGLKK